MPLSMITTYSSISLEELGVLERQFEKSHFAQTSPSKRVKKLAIFDFDSTLFFSPLLSPTIWHPNLIRLATSESIYGPGWWRDIRSLDLGPVEELERNAWKGYWNEKIVADARACIADKDTMTVVLTGRRYHPFHQLIPAMLKSKGLQFDLVGLRPDPESVSEYQWQGDDKKSAQSVSYNLTGSVFKSTMHFKTCFILNLLHKIPSLESVVMWDDRLPHVKRFKEFLDAVKRTDAIEEGQVIHVPGIRPKYNPEWEKRVITHIIQTHNKALVEYQSGKKTIGKIMERLEWTPIIEDPLSMSEKIINLAPQPAQTVIALTTSCIHNLQTSFSSLFQSQCKQNKRSKWKVFGGEEPQFFGDYVYLSQKVLSSTDITLGPVGTLVDLTILAYSVSPRIPCLLLKVQVKDQEHILPLWYKPSEFFDLFRLKDIQWQPIRSNHRSYITDIQGEINYAYRLGVIETPLRIKRRLSPNNDISPIPTSRLRTTY
ncbi:hypothetical protein INT47_012900 [Mucor saturninus]|uniref:Swiss Army Knife RNA repair protein HAD domain-containing protein n=1 Tax=Mucor saturninus TaxID=64648 RepID=A0A8H7QRL3_9FUNG|nr:hypothetical protein INT47_012900 [Mucor saturninus]